MSEGAVESVRGGRLDRLRLWESLVAGERRGASWVLWAPRAWIC